ncbi:UNVERIFIED_CONTAM: hypothetical protein GTU68_024208 [Idotea baltica]|nr:hypothetical protein [Idotea baltica]
MVVGAICALIFLGMSFFGLSQQVALFLAILSGVIATGALHEDGLADTADGLGAGKSREHSLTIMKDSTIGSYGAIALIAALILRLTLYSDVFANDMGGFSATVLIASTFVAAHAVSRGAMVMIVWSLPYAREAESAKVPPLSEPPTKVGVLVAVAITIISVIPVAIIFGVGAGIVGIGVAIGAMLGLRLLFDRKLQGWTGDTAGATQQMSEISFLLAVTAWT